MLEIFYYYPLHNTPILFSTAYHHYLWLFVSYPYDESAQPPNTHPHSCLWVGLDGQWAKSNLKDLSRKFELNK